MGTTTPLYGLFKPEVGKGDSLSAVATNFNNNGTKIVNAAKPYKGVYANYAAIPSGFSGAFGDVIYLQDFKSEFIYLGSDPYWGKFWRPVQARYGPWISVPSTAIVDANYTIDGGQPLQYRISNDGRIEWRGGVAIVSGTIPIFSTTATSVFAFNHVPVNIRPVGYHIWPCGVYPIPNTATASTIPILDMYYSSTSFDLYFRNWAVGVTSFFFNSISWQIGKI